MLKSSQEDLATNLRHNNFKATDGLLSQWKCRFGIKFEKAYGKKANADAVNVEQRKPTKLQNFRNFAQMIAIMMMKAMLSGSLSYKHTTLSGSKKAMDRVTVLCSSDIPGTDKWKLLIIGKRVKPRCFKGISMDMLPALCYSNKIVWMTYEIFTKWPMRSNMELQRKSGKDLLVLDKYAAYTHLDSLKYIYLEFLSPNYNPIDNGHKK
jgi:hypothetical protein